MKIRAYNDAVEGEYIVFRPIVGSDNETAETIALVAFRIINTYRVNLKLWKAITDCIYKKWLSIIQNLKKKCDKRLKTSRMKLKC